MRFLKLPVLFLFILTLVADGNLWAQNSRDVASRKSSRGKGVPSRAGTNLNSTERRALTNALNLAKNKNYREASVHLYKMSRDPKFRNEHMQIKYILGLMLMEMGFYQAASYQFVEVVRSGNNRYIRDALEKLVIVADQLNDDTLFNYALSRVKLKEYPRRTKDMLMFRVGEYLYRSGQWNKSIQSFRQVPRSSSFYAQAKYMEALAYTEKGDINRALKTQANIVRYQRGTSPTDTNKVAALMAIARLYYQNKNWDKAIEFYRRIPRDSPFWHDALFEMSWALMRASKFRGVLSNFHSLHSPYYEDYYLPESVLLRGIVYLYICQYDEMEKTVSLFDRVYLPVLKNVAEYIKTNKNNTSQYFNDYSIVYENASLEKDREARAKFSMPYVVVQKIRREADVMRIQKHLDRLGAEQRILDSEVPYWKDGAIGQFVRRALNSRLKSTRAKSGRMIRSHMIDVYNELRDLAEQNGFARYEMLNSKREFLKKKVAGRGIIKKSVEEDNDRTYYIQNGFEYWPFRGEYWLDEIGNYYYLGNQSCE